MSKKRQKRKFRGYILFYENQELLQKQVKYYQEKNKTFLKLYRGLTQEKIGDKINFIKFEETTFDFSKYQNKNISYPKLNERNLKWLIKNLNNTSYTENKNRN